MFDGFQGVHRGGAVGVHRVRNLAIGLIPQAGYTKTTATIRRIKHDPALLMAILGLKTPS